MLNNTLPKRLNDFLIYIETMQGKSINTVNGYKIDNVSMLRYVKGCRLNVDFDEIALKTIDISDIDDEFIKNIEFEDLCAFIFFLSNPRKGAEKGNGNSDKARKVSSMVAFFDYLVKKVNLILPQNNPATELEKPKVDKKAPVYLELDESFKLLDEIKDDLEWKRDYCIITLFLNCGMRISELYKINIPDIKENTISIMGKGGKPRTAYLNEMCIEAINQWLEVRKSKETYLTDEDSKKALFINKKHKRLGDTGVRGIVTKWSTKAGLNEDGKKVKPHSLRHTCASQMVADGESVMMVKEVLGHESISTSQIYIHLNNKKIQDAVRNNSFNNRNKDKE